MGIIFATNKDLQRIEDKLSVQKSVINAIECATRNSISNKAKEINGLKMEIEDLKSEIKNLTEAVNNVKVVMQHSGHTETTATDVDQDKIKHAAIMYTAFNTDVKGTEWYAEKEKTDSYLEKEAINLNGELEEAANMIRELRDKTSELRERILGLSPSEKDIEDYGYYQLKFIEEQRKWDALKEPKVLRIIQEGNYATVYIANRPKNILPDYVNCVKAVRGVVSKIVINESLLKLMLDHSKAQGDNVAVIPRIISKECFLPGYNERSYRCIDFKDNKVSNYAIGISLSLR